MQNYIAAALTKKHISTLYNQSQKYLKEHAPLHNISFCLHVRQEQYTFIKKVFDVGLLIAEIMGKVTRDQSGSSGPNVYEVPCRASGCHRKKL